MSSSVWSSASSGNPSLAWSMGNAGKGRMLIKFPLPLKNSWYSEQPCTKFRTFEHRKERKGFQHEFIVLRLLDGSLCRIERMGDPDARFDALSPQGSVAHDMAQCFRPENLDQACLETSDVISAITLPVTLDLMDVLMICRAIQEGEETRNYTLQVFNCYFFSLAIQVCLTRLVACWEDRELFVTWLSQATDGILALPSSLPLSSNPGLLRGQPFILSLDSVLFVCKTPADSKHILVDEIKDKLERYITKGPESAQNEIIRRVDEVLWHSSIKTSLAQFLEDKIKEVVLDFIKKRMPLISNSGAGELSSGKTKNSIHLEIKLLSVLVALLDLAGTKLENTTIKYSPKSKRRKEAAAHQAESHSTLNITELDFDGRPSVRATRSTAADLCRWIITYLPYLSLWLIDAALSTWGVSLFSPGVNVTQCVAIDEKLGQVAVDLEHLRTITDSDLERSVEMMHALIQNEVAIWDKNPWADICDFILQHVAVDVPKDIEIWSPEITFSLQGQADFQSASISVFQRHILERIKMQARQVEGVGLGCAKDIQNELKDKLSLVWKLIRDWEGANVAQEGTQGLEESPVRLTVEDAIAYLEMVKSKVGPEGYNQFLDILGWFKYQAIDAREVMKQVCSLLSHHDDLVQGFKKFLPHDHYIVRTVNNEYRTIAPCKTPNPLTAPNRSYKAKQLSDIPDEATSIGSMAINFSTMAADELDFSYYLNDGICDDAVGAGPEAEDVFDSSYYLKLDTCGNVVGAEPTTENVFNSSYYPVTGW